MDPVNMKDDIMETQIVNAAYGMAQSLTPTAGKKPKQIAKDVVELARELMKELRFDFSRPAHSA